MLCVKTKGLKYLECLRLNVCLKKSSYCHLSRIMIKPAYCICENNDVDQLHGSLCVRYVDSTIPLLT